MFILVNKKSTYSTTISLPFIQCTIHHCLFTYITFKFKIYMCHLLGFDSSTVTDLADDPPLPLSFVLPLLAPRSLLRAPPLLRLLPSLPLRESPPVGAAVSFTVSGSGVSTHGGSGGSKRRGSWKQLAGNAGAYKIKSKDRTRSHHLRKGREGNQ